MTEHKILVCGLGSIGKRHLKNILSLGYKNVSAVTSKPSNTTEFKEVNFFNSIEDAFQKSFFHIVFICTPTSSHKNNLLQLLNLNVKKIYLEKPVSDSYEKIDEIIVLSKKNNCKIVVGYDLHFDEGIQKVKQLFSENAIGKIVAANAFAGQHLSQWRPYENYRNGMSAKKKSGGGVLLDLIHEFDYLIWILGEIKSVACNFLNSGFLEIETEESADVLIRFSSGISGSIHLDYLQPEIIRHCIFTGTAGTITLDLAKQSVKYINSEGLKKEYNYSGKDRNERFLVAIKTFIENENDERLTDIKEGIKSLRAVLAAKISNEEKRFAEVEAFF